MSVQKIRSFVLIATLLLSSLTSWAIDPNVQDLVTYETRSNAVAERSDKGVKLEHYEIPLRYVEADLAQRLTPEMYDALIVTKNGEPHVRWIINPEDTKWHKELEIHLRAQGLSTKRHKHFIGYMTASRSYIIEDPTTGAQFSAKVSTDKTGGNWKDKKQPIKDAQEIRMATDFVHEEQLRKPFEHIVSMDEPAMFGIKAVDQAMLIRLLGGLTEGRNIYLPGFSAVHEQTGAEIARRNGSENPAEFWNEHYNKPLARALAEFAARTGLTYDSPHSQNFLIELDSNMRPTGRIVLRDFGDAYLLAELAEAKGRSELLRHWETDNVIRGRLHMAVGILHGNTAPSWIPDNTYSRWGSEFFREFVAEFSRQSGIPAAELAGRHSRNGLYFSRDFKINTPAWQAWLTKLKEQRSNVAPNSNTRPSFNAGNCRTMFQ